MLTELSIENFAIIDRLLMRFSPGLTVLTGETGAGKSIIIDALQAALGAKVPADVVRSGARMAAIEAIFEVEDERMDDLREMLDEIGIEEDDYLILRREISAAGRGTARLNGRAVPLSVLSSIGGLLVDIHGQSDHLSVLRRDRQLDVLDRFGGLLDLRLSVAGAIKEYTRLRRSMEDLAGGQRDAEQRLDLLRFQTSEIEGADLRGDEEDELTLERTRLSNAERLTQLSARAYDVLQSDAAAVTDGVTSAAQIMRDLAAVDPAVNGIAERLDAARYEVEDIALEVRQYRDRVEADPDRLNAIEERLDLLTRLKRKYGPSLEDVIAFGDRVRQEMEAIDNLDERLAEVASDLEGASRSAADLAGNLSAARSQAAAALAAAMKEALRDVGLNSAAFEVELSRSAAEDGLALPDGHVYAYSQSGVDTVSFLVSFNAGEPLRPLDRVASGGETSRFLLALKSVLARADRTPVLVFDEVDVGVGGRRAADIGARMRALSQNHQVVSITHLPQIAALADQHVTVAKAVRDGRTGVDVRLVENAERVAEIAEMMTGTGTEAARRNAQELLEAAQQAR